MGCVSSASLRALVQALAGGHQTRLQRFGVRFSSPVFPDETIRTEYWALGYGDFAFRARVIERDVIVLTGGSAHIAAA
jgi:acyl dehydratase